MPVNGDLAFHVYNVDDIRRRRDSEKVHSVSAFEVESG